MYILKKNSLLVLVRYFHHESRSNLREKLANNVFNGGSRRYPDCRMGNCWPQTALPTINEEYQGDLEVDYIPFFIN